MCLVSITTFVQSLPGRDAPLAELVVLLAMYSLACAVFFIANRPIFSNVSPGKPAAWWRQLIWAVAASGLVILGIRGGFQLKPLATAHANVFPEPALASLILNTPFNIYHSLKRKPLRELPVQADWGNVLAAVSQPPHRHSFIGQRRDNVVILIMESCGSSFSRLFSGDTNAPDCTPFLDSLAQHGLYFTNGFANGRRSIEAVSSILAGLPSLIDDPFIASPFCNSPLAPLPGWLARAGYTTAFSTVHATAR